MAKTTLEKRWRTKDQPLVLNQAEIDELHRSPAFSSQLLISPRTERPFYYFKYHGQQLEGFLGHEHTNANIRRAQSRIIETPNDGIQEFFVNKSLARVFDKFQLEGKYIRITYIGQEFTGFGHARKCYQVEQMPVTSRDSGVFNSGKPREVATK